MSHSKTCLLQTREKHFPSRPHPLKSSKKTTSGNDLPTSRAGRQVKCGFFCLLRGLVVGHFLEGTPSTEQAVPLSRIFGPMPDFSTGLGVELLEGPFVLMPCRETHLRDGTGKHAGFPTSPGSTFSMPRPGRSEHPHWCASN